MDWLSSIRKSINYMEEHLLTVQGVEEISKNVYMSAFYLQKGFKLMTGYSIAEYIRNRKMYLAALDIISDKEKVIDIAYKYGYDTPESFTKAFSRFHGCTPSQLKDDTSKIKIFLPLKISIVIKGGNDMDYSVEKMNGFKVIGFEKKFSYDSAYKEIPEFWNKAYTERFSELFKTGKPSNQIEETICNCFIGKYGVNIDDIGNGKFRYFIAGDYKEGDIPEGMKVYEFPDMEWAKFVCKGPLPEAMQTVNTKIFNEWLPGNDKYDIAMGVSIELYPSPVGMKTKDYESYILIPVKKKA